jgi:hypothetical protein
VVKELKIIKTYTELKQINNFEDRYDYLKLNSIVGESTFGYDRYLNQMLYRSKRWLQIRDSVIIRDNGCDLGIEGYEIFGKVIIHHMNPITIKDIETESDNIFNPEFLISVSMKTHNAIHFGDDKLLSKKIIERTRNDTCLWR